MCLLVRTPWIGAVILFLGMLAEERCAAAIPFVVLWHFLGEKDKPWRGALLWILFLIVAVGFWLAYYYFALRHFLTPESLASPEFGGISFRLLRKNISILPISFFESIRGGWMVIGFSIVLLANQRRWLIVGAILAGVIGCLLQAGFVADISRSASVVWPLLLLSIRVIFQSDPLHGLFLLKTAVIFNFLTPCYQVIGATLNESPSPFYLDLFYPLPIAIVRWLSPGL